MLDQRVRGVIRLALALCVLGACEAPLPAVRGAAPVATDGDRLRAYVRDPKVGREALEASLVSRTNSYATLRLGKYRPSEWGALPVYDPPTTPIRTDAAAQVATNATWASCDGAADTDEALRALGERAFFEYPAQLAPALPHALATPDHAGVWSDRGRFGAVWAKTAGGVQAAYTCATCHASPSAHGLVAGRNNADLDAGRISGDGESGPAWSLGRVDVTTDGLDNPVSISDLRALRWQKRMHHAATLRNDLVALAVRIETLIITSNAEAIRPPRRIAAALAMYLVSLANGTPRAQLVLGPTETAGAAVFERTCAKCHGGDGASGESVPLAVVGTDPAVGQSSERGTGAYRIPSLRSVGDRRRLFASGAVDDVEQLLDSSRSAVGHPFGLDLDDSERTALLAYLRRL